MDNEQRQLFWDKLCSLPGTNALEEAKDLFATITYPKHIVRYRSVSAQSINAMQNNQLFFSKPACYDDPFDTYFYVNYRLLQQSTDVMYSILANPAHQRDIKDTLMASGIPKEKIDTAIEKTLAHPVRGDSFRELVKESRNRILQIRSMKIYGSNMRIIIMALLWCMTSMITLPIYAVIKMFAKIV